MGKTKRWYVDCPEPGCDAQIGAWSIGELTARMRKHCESEHAEKYEYLFNRARRSKLAYLDRVDFG